MDRTEALARLRKEVEDGRLDELQDLIFEFVQDYCTDVEVRELAQLAGDRLESEG